MGIGVWELLLIFLIVLLLFGTKKLKTIGGDLGGAIRSFKTAIDEPESPGSSSAEPGVDGSTPAGLAAPKS